jgi:hypothetical protein
VYSIQYICKTVHILYSGDIIYHIQRDVLGSVCTHVASTYVDGSRDLKSPDAVPPYADR